MQWEQDRFERLGPRLSDPDKIPAEKAGIYTIIKEFYFITKFQKRLNENTVLFSEPAAHFVEQYSLVKSENQIICLKKSCLY